MRNLIEIIRLLLGFPLVCLIAAISVIFYGIVGCLVFLLGLIIGVKDYD